MLCWGTMALVVLAVGGGDCGLCRQRTLGIDTGGAAMMLYTAGTLALLLLGRIVALSVLRWLEARQ
jgi:hypothetical protein